MLTVLVILWLHHATADRGYIVTAPSRFRKDVQEKVCVDFVNVNASMTVEFNMIAMTYINFNPYSASWVTNKTWTLAKAALQIPSTDSGGCAFLSVPGMSTRGHGYRLSVSGYSAAREGADWKFNDSNQVSIAGHDPSLVFIETDKPIYKAGQLVQIRILLLDTALRPVNTTINSVVIQTPTEIRVEQWNKVQPRLGLVLLKFQLSTEPLLGQWMIQADVSGITEKKYFRVDEYVLPKFDVSIKSPKRLTFNMANVTVEICASYTYGQPVKGIVDGSICLRDMTFEQFYSSRFGHDVPQYCALIQTAKNEACLKVNVSRQEVGWDRYSSFVSGVYLEINCTVKEAGTGSIGKANMDLNFDDDSTVPKQDKSDIVLSMDIPKKFKPGLPFRVQISVTKSDGSPNPGRIIQITVTGSRQFVRNYTSDAAGKIALVAPYGLLPISTVTVLAEAIDSVVYYYTTYEYRNGILLEKRLPYYQTGVSGSAEGWYSPSASFLQIQPPAQPIQCQENTTLRIDYTATLPQKAKLMYQVVGTSKIVMRASRVVELSPDSKINATEEASGWKTVQDFSSYLPESSDNDAAKYATVQPMHRGSVNITIPVSASLSPRAHIVVYYVRGDGELVADDVSLDIESCTDNKVVMSFSKNTTLPGGEITLGVKASPNSLCGYDVVDKSVYLQGGYDRLSTTQVVTRLLGFSLPPNPFIEDDTRRCPPGYTTYKYSNKDGRIIRSVIAVSWNIRKEYSDSSRGFVNTGLIIMTNQKVHVTPCFKTEQLLYTEYVGSVSDDLPYEEELQGPPTTTDVPAATEAPTAAMTPALETPGALGAPGPQGPAVRDGQRSARGNDGIPGAPGRDGSPGRDAVNGAPSSPIPQPKVIQLTALRSYFPETWLFNLIQTDDRGEASVRVEVPHTITQWVGNAVCNSQEHGVGVASPTNITAFQPFFVDMTLPYSVIRGERIPLLLTISNYLSECLVVKLDLIQSDSYSVIGKPTTTHCVCAMDTVTVSYRLITNKIGDVNISITASTIPNNGTCPPGSLLSNRIGLNDTVIKPLAVKPEGAPREYTISEFVCLSSGNPQAANQLLQMDLIVPNVSNIVAGSERASIKVSGDIMGPALANLGSLLRMPRGSGEQNMAATAPNIYILKYLNAINKDLPALRRNAIQYMKTGYQTQLQFAGTDHSYSAFGRGSGKPGSTWLTAFVVKSYGGLKAFIQVDENHLAGSIGFLKGKQMTDGCFSLVGMVHDKHIQGGLGAKESMSTALTAYVIAAMIEAGVPRNDSNITKGLGCLQKQQYPDAYTTALVAYAFSLVDPSDPRAADSFSRLMAMQRTDNIGQKFWTAAGNETVSMTLENYWWSQPVSADVETTSYALLTIVRMASAETEKIRRALPVIRWLNKQRNIYGGFSSTQDTVIGIQALAEYASWIHRDKLGAVVRVAQRSMGRPVASFNITDENSFVEYSSKLPAVTNLDVSVAGIGCILFQANVRYSVMQPYTGNESFVTEAQAFRVSANISPCTNLILRLCTRYTGKGESSNMAMIEAHIPTGWSPDRQSLKSLVKTVREGGAAVMKVDVDIEGTVQLYLNEITRISSCFSFPIEKVMDAQEVKPALVVTYDFYKPELKHETSYKVWSCSGKLLTDMLPTVIPILPSSNAMTSSAAPSSSPS